MKPSPLTTGSILLIFLIVLSTIFIPGYAWGINSLGYLPLIYTLAAAAFSITAFLIISNLAGKQLSRSSASSVSFKPVLIWCLAASVLVFLLYYFRSATQLWGDGYLRANETLLGGIFHFSEPFDKLIQYIAFHTLGTWFALKSYQSYQIVSIFGGLFYFTFAVWLSDNIGKLLWEKLLIACLLMTSGLVQLFFGYVECYSLATPLFLLSIGLIYMGLKKNTGIVPAFMVYFLACLFHVSFLTYLPAFLAVAIIKFKDKRNKSGKTALAVGIAGPILIALFVFILTRFQFEGGLSKNLFEYLFVPWLPNADNYWLLAPRHLLDILNQLMLTAPAAIIILAAMNPFRINYRKNSFELFLVILSLCGLLFMLLFATSFGLGRDWDLFSPAAIPLNLLAAFLLIRKASNVQKSFSRFIPILPALLITTGFILANSRAESSLSRYRAIMDQSAYGRHLNLENLSNYYFAEQDTTGYYETLRAAARIFPHPRYYHKIATQMLNDGLTEKAVEQYYKALEIDSSYTPTLNYLGITFGELGAKDPRALDLAEGYFKQVLHFDPDYTHIHSNLGQVYLGKHLPFKAIDEFRQAIIAEPKFLEGYQDQAQAFAEAQMYDSSEYYYQTLIKKEPDYFEGYINLAGMLNSIGRKNDAAQVLGSAAKKFSRPEQRLEIAKGYALLPSYDKSVGILEDLTSRDNCPVQVYITLANIYNVTSQRLRGLGILSYAAEKNRGAEDNAAIAEAFLQLGAADSTEVYLLNVITRDSRYADGYLKLGTLYLLMGRKEKAGQVLMLGLENVSDTQKQAQIQALIDKINNL